MACLVAITDALLRVRASDVPSLFCLHYAGAAEGPLRPFGFDVGNFATESEYLRFASPELNTTRTQVLDYFTQQRPALVQDDHVLFNFEYGMALSPAENRLLSQLCLATGFPQSSDLLAWYWTGEVRPAPCALRSNASASGSVVLEEEAAPPPPRPFSAMPVMHGVFIRH